MTAGTNELAALYEELESMLAAAGIDVGPPDRAEMADQIRRVEEAISPLHLHPHLVWFWQNWPRLGREFTVPGFTDPGFALEILDQMPFLKPVITMGYDGHQYLFAELSTDRDSTAPGPRIYVYDQFGEERLRLISLGFADLLRYMIATMEMEEPINFVEQVERLGAWLPPTVPESDKTPINPADTHTWPQQWQAASGITTETFQLRGPSHSVAQLEEARRRGPVTATLVGRVQNLAGSGTGSVVRLTDDTGSVQLLIPPGVVPLGASSSSIYEVDVVAQQLTGPEEKLEDFDGDRAELIRGVLDGDWSDVARLAGPMGFHVTGDHPIVATAKRPVDRTDG